ncbi:MAG: acyl-CoA dehydrogenase [Bacteroidetes bacterium GWF2_33_16]|nr:MAG: acyl-CoA dehydrogenase [Bacteroidetes bacterium GWE2_32_14]OFY02330.1 MAG: acyl-CoA dehydrogenase [Bacteroidetes bacterium GWF2_33_16]
MIEEMNIIEEVKLFAEKEIRPYASNFETTEALPRALIVKMAEKGFLSAPFPKEYGGMGLNPIIYGLLTEEIGKACCSTRALLTVHTSLVGETILSRGSDEQKKFWLPLMASGDKIGAFALTEPDVGTDAKSVKTNYVRVGDTFVINGNKKWITFGGIADFFIVIASNNDEITAFIVDRNLEGVQTKRINGLIGSRAAFVAEVEFKDVHVSENCILGQIGNGYSYIVNSALDFGRHSIAWAGLAIAQESLDSMVSYARQRKQFGKAIYTYQLIQGIIGDAVTNIHAARSLCLSASKMRMEKHEDSIIETSIAKYFTSKIANKIASDAVQVHGGNGCSNNYPVERLFREAKILEIIEGTSQIQQEIISKFGLRRYFKSNYKYIL